jgi:flagellar basal-body rod modification protein FlgD
MVSSKIGTQNWSKATQTPAARDTQTHTAPAIPLTESAGGSKDGAEKNIGDVLNQIANPGGKDPTRQSRKAHNTLDKDDFMKLMLTQMKNQDPLSPLQSHEMAAQLAQFTSLEQLFNVNKNLEGLSKTQDPIQKFQALNFLGKTINSDTREVFRVQGDTNSDLHFNLGTDAVKAKIVISDDQGQEVKSIEMGGLKKGSNKVIWGGSDDMDRDVKPGHYSFSVEAINSAGHKIAVQTATHGTITGVNYTAEGPMLMIGDQKIRLQDVQKIEDENLKDKQNHEEDNMQGVPPEILKAAMAKAAETMGDVKGNGVKTSEHSANPKVKPEDKPVPKLKGAVIPLEVSSSNKAGASHAGTVSTGGPFASR